MRINDLSSSLTKEPIQKQLFLVDVSHFLFRAYHALPPLTCPEGKPVGAVYGLSSMILKLLDAEKPEALAVVFDSSVPTFRHDLFPNYKANRDAPPEDLIPQFPLAKDLCASLGLPTVQKNGFEADDLMASYALAASNAGMETVLVSSDKDLMQLVTPQVQLFDAMKNRRVDAGGVQEKFGVPPHQVIQVQALMGDSSDNIPGVPGIGPKTAADLIQRFGDLKTLYARIEEIQRPKLKNALIQNKDKAFLSEQLVTLRTDVPLDLSLDDLILTPPNPEKALAFFRAQGFKTLAKRLQEKWGAGLATPVQSVPDLHWSQAAHHSQVSDFLSQTRLSGKIAVHCFPDTSCIALFDPEKNTALMIPSSLKESSRQSLKDALQSPMTQVITHDLASLVTFLSAPHTLAKTVFESNAETQNSVQDTLLAAYLLKGPVADKTPLDILSLTQPNHPVPKTQCSAQTTDASEEQNVPENNPLVLAQETWAIWNNWRFLQQKLMETGTYGLYATLDKPLTAVLTRMKTHGIGLCAETLQTFGAELDLRIQHSEADALRLAGTQFNPASPKQLAQVLFEDLKLTPEGRKGKAGHHSTSTDVLESLNHPIADALLAFRSASKLKNTYVEGLLKAKNPETGRIHTTFVMTGTATGRLASKNPNLQNIPIRDAEGRRIRNAFVPQAGHAFLSLDYSQIELRLLAHIGNVTPLIQAFRSDQDIHKKTASEMFEKSLNDVTPEDRRTAKMINFGIIYGISAFGLAKRLGLKRDVADQYIQDYLTRYAGIRDYMNNQIALGKRQGYVQTLWGRPVFLPDIHNRAHPRRAAAERLAINAPLQGTSADIIKKAMIQLDQLIQKKRRPIKMLLQIHDELLFEGPQEALEEIQPQLSQIMENVCTLRVPLTVHSQISQRWT